MMALKTPPCHLWSGSCDGMCFVGEGLVEFWDYKPEVGHELG